MEELKKIRLGQEYLLERMRLSNEEILLTENMLPRSSELNLRHFDILLETGKNFLVIASTALIASLAVDAKSITNIDVNLIRYDAAVFVTIAPFLMLYLLYKRGQYVEKINDSYIKINELRRQNLDIQREIISILEPEIIKTDTK